MKMSRPTGGGAVEAEGNPQYRVRYKSNVYYVTEISVSGNMRKPKHTVQKRNFPKTMNP